MQCTWDDTYIHILVGKPEGKESIRRAGRRCEDNVKVDLKEIVCELDQFALEQSPRAGSHECGNEIWGSIKSGRFLD
jgi:hypothetical protein